MNSKRNDWKVLKIFTLAVIAAIFSASLSKAVVVQASAMSERTIEQRLAKVRESLKQIEEQSERESDTISSLQISLETEKNKTLQAQWPNYWNNWSDWSDWNKHNVPWNNWSNWNNYNVPWNNWSDWSDWNNQY